MRSLENIGKTIAGVNHGACVRVWGHQQKRRDVDRSDPVLPTTQYNINLLQLETPLEANKKKYTSSLG